MSLIHTKQKGFTLVEMLVYLAIFITLSVAGVTTMLHFSRVFTEYRVEKMLTQQITASLDTMVSDIRNAVLVDQIGSTFAVSNGTLGLSYVGYDVLYEVLGGVLVRSESGAASVALTHGPVTIDMFLVEYYPTTESELIRVTVAAHITQGAHTFSETYYVSSVLRGSYD